MEITDEALKLTKKFADGALCKIDFEHIEATMFWPFYEAIAKRKKKKEIDGEVVKEYWFKIHNNVVFKRFQRGKLTIKQAKNCMVRPSKKKDKLVCVHGGIIVCAINKKEAKILEKGIHKL